MTKEKEPTAGSTDEPEPIVVLTSEGCMQRHPEIFKVLKELGIPMLVQTEENEQN